MRIETTRNTTVPKTHPTVDSMQIGEVFRRVRAHSERVQREMYSDDVHRLFMRTQNHSTDPSRRAMIRTVSLADGEISYMTPKSQVIRVEGAFFVMNWGED